jgi:hypothetical protein
MNCDEDYDDEKERLRTHPKLLPTEEGPVDAATVTGTIEARTHDPAVHRRSVLGGEQKSAGKKMQKVMRDTSLNHVQKNDVKVRRLHLEVVKARVLRAKMMARRRPVSE